MSRRDDDLQREIRRHLELEAADREADGLSPEEARTLGAAVALLTIAAVFACYLPARRLSRVDPVRVLRAD